VFPGYYDPATGGVMLADESYEQGAIRELEEEMGIRNVSLTWLFDFYFADDRTRVWGRAFSCMYDGPLTLQEEEVESVSLMTIDDILHREQTKQFTPDGLYVVQQYREQRGRS
jgi:ADP-ribose pyrophosphatase YjhB (NUDIX family)